MLRGKLAMVLARLDMLDNAEKEYQAAIKLSPVDEELRYAHGQLARAHVSSHRSGGGIQHRVDARSGRDSKPCRARVARGEKATTLEKAESYIRIALERKRRRSPGMGMSARDPSTRLLQEQGDLDRGIGLLVMRTIRQQAIAGSERRSTRSTVGATGWRTG